MSILSSLASSAGNLLNKVTGAEQQQAQNWKYQKQAMQNAHQWEVADLKAAGLNPILSAGGQGANTGGAGGISSGAGSVSDVANSALAFNQLKNDNVRVQNETNLATSQAGMNNAAALKNAIESGLLPEKTEAEVKDRLSNAAKNTAQTVNLATEKQRIKADIELKKAQTEEAKESAKYNKERARGYHEEETITNSGGASILGTGGTASMTRHSARTY